VHRSFYDRARRRVRDLQCGQYRIWLDLEIRRVDCRTCHAVKRERLEFLLERAPYTRRFARYVGRRCGSETIKDVAKELLLGWDAVKELDKQYMREQLERASKPNPRIIGIAEISVHDYRIVGSNLERQRPIWFGGKDRKEVNMDEFYAFLGGKKARKIRLAVIDMWSAFYNSTRKHAP
jgi:transposase